MNPFAGLGLAHAKEERLDGLQGVDLEVKQDEEQAISIRAQQWFATTTALTLARLLAALLGLIFHVGRGLMKRRQQIEKCLERKASQHLKHRWLGGNSSKCQHREAPHAWNVIAIIPQVPYFRLSLL